MSNLTDNLSTIDAAASAIGKEVKHGLCKLTGSRNRVIIDGVDNMQGFGFTWDQLVDWSPQDFSIILALSLSEYNIDLGTTDE